jgi:hypothetical protein
MTMFGLAFILGALFMALFLWLVHLTSAWWHRRQLRRFAARDYRRQPRERELEAALRVTDRPQYFLGHWNV